MVGRGTESYPFSTIGDIITTKFTDKILSRSREVITTGLGYAASLKPLATFFPSKKLYVRAVYFDKRRRSGHQNASVFLVTSLKTITDRRLIIGCQIDNMAADKYDVRLIGDTRQIRNLQPTLDHEEFLVHCYDLPAMNGSMGYIMYKTAPDSDILIAASERPLFIPAPRVKPTSPEGHEYNMTVLSCGKLFGNPPWLKEWLIYQKTLGVDHVHFDAEDTFIPKGELKDFLGDLVKEGFLSIDTWKKYLSWEEVWYHNQGLMYEDCPYRYLGTYDYIVMLDTDDFFIPRVTGEERIHYYINRFCSGEIGSCKFKWIDFFPDVFGFDSSISTKDGNVTRSLRSYTHYIEVNPKSLHRTDLLIDTVTHYATIMMPGYRIAMIPVSMAYVGHVRLGRKIGTTPVVSGLP